MERALKGELLGKFCMGWQKGSKPGRTAMSSAIKSVFLTCKQSSEVSTRAIKTIIK
jgi:hypothetical protein